MMMKRSWGIPFLLLLALLSAVAAGAYVARPGTAAVNAPASAAKAAPPPDELRYPQGAPQLGMLRAETLPLVALPAGDALNARVVYDEDVTARLSVSVTGRVVAIKVAPGATVRKGQTLAQIDSADVGAALADLQKAQADEERKRLVAERARDLAPGEAIAAKDLESARADYQQAQAETMRAERRLHQLNPDHATLRDQRMNLVSPINGVVVERNITPALEVGAGMVAPLFVVTDPKRLWLQIDVPDTMLAAVAVGAPVEVESDAFPGEKFHAVISQLGQSVDPNTRRVTVRAQVDNPAGKLLPEMYVRAALLKPQARAVKVPNSALVNRGLYTYVFVQTEPGRFLRRKVQMLTHGADASYLGTGVGGGDNIVTSGALLLDADMSTRAGGAP
ncbi:efflux RND transporter periplasmic adaptor subunit [Duganella lactea]|nr:efflux RND transporter periplasmic adaptor subunit [Duganella lactea]